VRRPWIASRRLSIERPIVCPTARKTSPPEPARDLERRRRALEERMRALEKDQEHFEALENALEEKQEALENYAEGELWRLIDSAIARGLAKPSD
jgi:hypothetical protein